MERISLPSFLMDFATAITARVDALNPTEAQHIHERMCEALIAAERGDAHEVARITHDVSLLLNNEPHPLLRPRLFPASSDLGSEFASDTSNPADQVRDVPKSSAPDLGIPKSDQASRGGASSVADQPQRTQPSAATPLSLPTLSQARLTRSHADEEAK